MPKFSAHVALMSPEYHPVGFAPGDEVPEWALDQVGPHVLEPEDAAETGATDDQEEDDDADGDAADSKPSDEQPDFTAAAPARRGRSRK